MQSSARRPGMVAWLFVLTSLGFTGSGAAVTVDLAPFKDNTIYETPSGNSNGSGAGLFVGRVGSFGGGTARRGLLAFDLSSIPAGSTVHSVTLTLEMWKAPNAAAQSITLHRVSSDWGEAGSSGTGTGDLAQTGVATWLFRIFGSQAWTTAGGDFTATPSGAQLVSGLGPYGWTGAGLVADVQFWVNNVGSNFGWLLRGGEATTSSVKEFYSREGLTPPRLTIDYTSAVGVGSALDVASVSFSPAWPAPASGSVNLSFNLPRATRVSLSIHDATGRVVRRLATGVSEAAGRRTVVWDGRTDSGTPAPSGVYLAGLVVEGVSYHRRLLLVK